MDIAILNYPTGEVEVIRGIDWNNIEAKYEGNVEEYLDDCGYDTNDIYYMTSDEVKINEISPNDL